MQACLPIQAFCRVTRSPSRLIRNFPRHWQRLYSVQSHHRVSVRCGSAGHVSVDLINIAEQPNSPLFIHLPSSPSNDNNPAPIPSFLQGKPVASINYRWNSVEYETDESSVAEDVWPTPVHDTLFAYNWLVENLSPQGLKRRAIYVYGSHIGASLAASLALTESKPHRPFAVRGLVSYNGIYNWTMFFPDHPANRMIDRFKRYRTTGIYAKPREGSYMHYLQQNLPTLFQSTADMFDVFASPSLLFHNPGLKVPSSYHMSEQETSAIEVLTNPNAEVDTPTKVPRKSYLVFPPRKSTLKIPETLLLYDTLPVPPSKYKYSRPSSGRQWGNSLELQAQELAGMMQRSIQLHEMKARGQWDDDIGAWENEPGRRVKVKHAGEEKVSLEMDQKGVEAVEEWLMERTPS
ncbi:uncharacterized protein FTOL_02940 [Fusarium torulosum]|uniref:Alpha/beta hydrolase fold-3 domain-containing protein n=1 Tax=Fusarium torulosum TaxID=33205 RepID=A0AAE8M323_9HYPO|nr:uncharacterized protein FTOL_02940 [Fusarium torulosum]